MDWDIHISSISPSGIVRVLISLTMEIKGGPSWHWFSVSDFLFPLFSQWSPVLKSPLRLLKWLFHGGYTDTMKYKSGKLVGIFAVLHLDICISLFHSSKNLCPWSTCFWENYSCEYLTLSVVTLPTHFSYFLLSSTFWRILFWEKNFEIYWSDRWVQDKLNGGIPEGYTWGYYMRG